MLDLLEKLRSKCVIGFLGGSDLAKITGQLAINGQDVTEDFDYWWVFLQPTPQLVRALINICSFAENGLTAIKHGKLLSSQSFIGFLGEEKYKKLVKFLLHYIADLDIPMKSPGDDRGTFIEFRNGMVNVSPIGRNASVKERDDFQAYDKIHNVRATLVNALKANFGDYGLTFSIGGQISFDMLCVCVSLFDPLALCAHHSTFRLLRPPSARFPLPLFLSALFYRPPHQISPNGWDKTYALRHVENEGFTSIHFFGDKTYEGGNDYEIFVDRRTIGHTVSGPEDTMRQIKALFAL
ncbi:phosphomannomutase, partial [Phenoliferia sp. Uapishka_3]